MDTHEIQRTLGATERAFPPRGHDITTPLVSPSEHTVASPSPTTPYVYDATKLTFSHLPAEIRNDMYAYALVPAHSIYESTAGQSTPREHRPSQECTMATCHALGLVSKQVRSESRTSFYALNHFVVRPEQCETSTVLAFASGLQRMGKQGRAVLTKLSLQTPHRYENEDVVDADADELILWTLLRECVALRHFNLEMHLDHLLAGPSLLLDTYLFGSDPEPAPCVSGLVSALCALQHRDAEIEICVDLCMGWDANKYTTPGGKVVRKVEVLVKRIGAKLEDELLQAGYEGVKDVDVVGRWVDRGNRIDKLLVSAIQLRERVKESGGEVDMSVVAAVVTMMRVRRGN